MFNHQMTQERMKILQMLSENRISAEEAARLLQALGQPGQPAYSPPPEAGMETDPEMADAPRYAPEPPLSPEPPRETGAESFAESYTQSSPPPTSNGAPHWFRVRVTDTVTGRAKTTVTLPYGLVNWGLKMGARFSPQVAQVEMDELKTILSSGLQGKIIDVFDEEDGEHVEIFIE